MAEPGEDDVSSDDIAMPATDGYHLAGTLYLPRGAKRTGPITATRCGAVRGMDRGEGVVPFRHDTMNCYRSGSPSASFAACTSGAP